MQAAGTEQEIAPATNNNDPPLQAGNGEILKHLEAYARERPDVAALWCLGIGFVLGWKLKPW